MENLLTFVPHGEIIENIESIREIKESGLVLKGAFDSSSSGDL